MVWKDKPPLPMDCGICRHDSDKRKEWGCDEDLPEVPEGLRFDCFYCHIGKNDLDPDHIDPDCTLCKGRGWWGPTRCPRKIVGSLEMAICESANMLELGMLPYGGGIRQYPAIFGQALSFVLKERGVYQRESARAEASKAKVGIKGKYK